MAYKTKKAESFCIVHPMLKKTFKQRILPWQEHMNSKSEVIDEDDLKKVKDWKKAIIYNRVRFRSSSTRKALRRETTTKNSYEKFARAKIMVTRKI